MRMDYTKLWNLLNSKSMTKSDLMATTGISSRVIAKLAKNQTVTTDVLSRICETLQCDISDIAECVDEEKFSIYQTYLSSGKVTDNNKSFKKVSFSKGEKDFTVYVSKQRATKATHIECRDNNTIYWVQYYPFCGLSRPSRVETPIMNPVCRKGETVIVLIKGNPEIISGLDEGVYVSSRGVPKSKNCIYVMTESEFKLWSLP